MAGSFADGGVIPGGAGPIVGREGDGCFIPASPTVRPAWLTEMLKVTLYARVGDSEVLNELATIEVEATATPIVQRLHGDAAEATMRHSVDVASALRRAAERFE